MYEVPNTMYEVCSIHIFCIKVELYNHIISQACYLLFILFYFNFSFIAQHNISDNLNKTKFIIRLFVNRHFNITVL